MPYSWDGMSCHAMRFGGTCARTLGRDAHAPRTASRSQTDRVAAARLAQLEKRLQKLRAEQEELNAKWEAERESMDRLQSIKEEIDRCE